MWEWFLEYALLTFINFLLAVPRIHLKALFDLMDANKNTFVSKMEFLEFIRKHKPKHGTYSSTAKLQSVFGLEKKHEVTRADFHHTFETHKGAGLDPSLFEEDAPVVERAAHAGGGKSTHGAGTGGDPLKGPYRSLKVTHFPATKDFPGTLIS